MNPAEDRRMQDFARSRRNMVDGQLRPNSVNSPAILAAMDEIPREAFLPSTLNAVAYADEDLPLPGGRAVLAPLVIGRLIQAAQPKPTDRALVLGAGVGYGAAVLSRLVAEVVALDPSPDLCAMATRALAALQAANVSVVCGPLEAGWSARAPYDLIIVEGALMEIPGALQAQLAEQGRLVGVVATAARRGIARLFLKAGGALSGRPLFDAAASLLPGLQRPAGFQFAP
jgi:protein-L-isoaspartate(D-aspartate) O-methyltransferase